jgi:hypothetical protein
MKYMDLSKAKVFSQEKTLTQYKNKIRMIIVVYITISHITFYSSKFGARRSFQLLFSKKQLIVKTMTKC